MTGADGRKKVRRLAYCGLLVALITLTTVVFRVVIPPLGYYHIGDAAVLLSGMLLGPYGAFPAAVGAGLADLLGGFPNYIFYRAFIKGVMALLAGRFIRVEEGVSRHNVAVLLLIGLWMILGYLLADTRMFASFQVALSLIPGNVIQGILAASLGCALLSVRRHFPKDLRR